MDLQVRPKSAEAEAGPPSAAPGWPRTTAPLPRSLAEPGRHSGGRRHGRHSREAQDGSLVQV